MEFAPGREARELLSRYFPYGQAAWESLFCDALDICDHTSFCSDCVLHNVKRYTRQELMEKLPDIEGVDWNEVVPVFSTFCPADYAAIFCHPEEVAQITDTVLFDDSDDNFDVDPTDMASLLQP
jgi:hypothetical protein